MVDRLQRACLSSAFLMFAFATPAAADDITALWLTDQDELFFFTETTTNDLIAIRLLSNLTEIEIYIGQLNGNSFELSSLDQDELLVGSFNGTQMSGMITATGTISVPFSATIFLDYLGSAVDGIWQTNLGNYLVIATTTFENAPLTAIVDIRLGQGAPAFDVFVGFVFFNAYAGSSLLDGRSLTISFSGPSASGFYGQASDSLSFTAARLFEIKPPAD